MTATQPASQETIIDLVGNAHGNLAKVTEILEEHPELINVSAPWVETPIQAATHMGNRPIADYLLSRGAGYDVFTAAMYGRRDDVERFLDENPSLIHSRGVHDMPILYFPAVSGEAEMLALLIDRGADVNEGAGQHTALHGAAQFGREAAVRLLLDRGANPGALNFENKTSLQLAEESGRQDVVTLLKAQSHTR